MVSQTKRVLRLSLAIAAAFSGLACDKDMRGSGGGSGGDTKVAGGGGKADPGPNAGVTPSPGGGDTILIGEYGSMTGSEATFGQSTHNGIELALAEQNAAGGVKGKKVKLVSYDDRGNAQEVGTVVTRLITQDKVVAIIGEVASSRSLAGGRVAQQYGVPMITPSSTNPEVTKVGDMIFRVCFLDSFQGYVVAKFAAETLKAKKVAILYDQAQAYSKGLKDFFKAEFTRLGGKITTEQAYTGGDPDFNAVLTTEYIPVVIGDLIVTIILVPVLVYAWEPVKEQLGR